MKTLILSCILFISQAKAECLQPVKKLEQGQAAPCSGFLFSPEKERELELKILDYEKLQRVASEQDNLINILKQRVDTQAEKNLLLQDRLLQQEAISDIQKFMYFGVGVLLTGICMKIAIDSKR